MKEWPAAGCLCLPLLLVAACGRSEQPQQTALSIGLSSADVSGGIIARKCTCDGPGASPELSWNSAPPGTQSFAVIAIDEDTLLISLVGPFVHWLVYDIPATARALPAGIPAQKQLPDSTLQGMNDFDKPGYGGPCPRFKSTHRYSFTLYALDKKLGLPAGATMSQLLKAMQGHILAQGELTGKYRR